MAFKDITGETFGVLSVVSRMTENDASGSARWLCLCECGEVRVIAGTGLRAGRHKSCGCKSPRFVSSRTKLRGIAGTPTYNSWAGMLHRCSSAAKGKERRNYFEKGVRVCDRWHDFANFIADMGERPAGTSIDRIDGSRGYSPDNCRWATSKQQANNTAANHLVTLRGKTQTVAQWAEEVGVKQNTLLYRLRRGTPPEKALSKKYLTPAGEAANSRLRACASCGKTFRPRTSQVRSGTGRCCSRSCDGDRRRNTGRLTGAAGELLAINETLKRVSGLA